MRYKNYTNEAIYELERQRIMEDDSKDPEYECENGCTGAPIYNAEGRLLCEDCLIEEVRKTFTSMLLSEDDDDFPCKIIKDIIDDFSDSEILTYIECRYEKV